MPNKEHEKWRKDRIDGISDGAGAVTQLTIKRSVDVLNSVIEDLEYSIDKTARASNRLSIVLVVATIIMALVAAADLYVGVSHEIDNKCPKITSNLSE